MNTEPKFDPFAAQEQRLARHRLRMLHAGNLGLRDLFRLVISSRVTLVRDRVGELHADEQEYPMSCEGMKPVGVVMKPQYVNPRTRPE